MIKLNNKRSRIFLIASCLLVLLVIVFILLRKESITALNVSKTVLPDTAYQHYDEKNIFFSNGRNFVKYDIQSGATTKLSKEYTLPDIAKIYLSKSKQFILFRTERQARNDSLGSVLQKEGYNLSSPFWWLLDTKTGRLSHFRDTVLDVDFNDEDLLYITDISPKGEGGGGNVVQTVNPASLKVVDTRYKKSCFGLRLIGESVYCTNANNTVDLLTGSGKSSFEDIAALYGSLAGDVAISKPATKNEENEFFTLNVKTGEKNSLGMSIPEPEPPLWSYSAKKALFVGEDNLLKSIDLYSNKRLSLAVKTNDTDNPVEPVIFFDNDSFFYRDDRSIFIASRQKLSDQKAPSKNYLVKLSDGLVISYVEESHGFYASKLGGIVQADKTRVYEQLKKDGFDPLLFRIDFKEVSREKLSS